jgi:hypothetical protein
MPRYVVRGQSEQEALLAFRRLLLPAEAAAALGVTRQAVQKSTAREGGKLLMWVFDAPSPSGRRVHGKRYLDFGVRGAQEDPYDWQAYRDDVTALIHDALEGAGNAASRGAGFHDELGRASRQRGDLMVLHLVASGVIALAEQTSVGRSPRGLYPDALQKGLDKLTVSCWRRNAEPPIGVPDLLRWCRTEPLARWPLDLPRAVGGDDRLLDGPWPTDFCREWAIDAENVEHEVVERRLLGDVFALCRRNDDQAGYVAFRKFLIQHPVITALELALACADPALSGLADQVRDAYEPVLLECVIDGAVICCATCGSPMAHTRAGNLSCGDDRCARLRGSKKGREIAADEEPARLRPALYTFVAAPGRAELRLAERLEGLGLVTELWPALDAYDLRIVFPDGEAWAVDVKDWASPVALARHVGRGDSAFPESPTWRRAFFAFPQERLRQRRDYVRAFVEFVRGVGGDSPVQAVGERTLVDLARRRLRVADPRRDGAVSDA